MPQVTLIDFGFTEKFYKDKNSDEHIQENTKIESFQGNILFSSHNQMSFYKTSRKDDLISLIQLMVYMLNDNAYVGTQKEEE